MASEDVLKRFSLIAADLRPLSYSVTAAISYARGKIAYCDGIEAAYPRNPGQMFRLRLRAATLLAILENSPDDLASLRDLREELRTGQNGEFGTGWYLLFDYVTRFIERLEHGGG
jgi:hypothetical protein